MTCGIPDGIELVFPRSYMRVECLSLDLRRDHRNFAYGNAEVTEEAAKLLQNRKRKAPVFLRIDNALAGRFFVPDDSVEIERSTTESTNRGYVDLLDPIRVLEDTTIDETYYNEYTIGDVIDDIMSKRDDPNNVLIGHRFVELDPESGGSLEGDDEIINLDDFFGEGDIFGDVISFDTSGGNIIEGGVTTGPGGATADIDFNGGNLLHQGKQFVGWAGEVTNTFDYNPSASLSFDNITLLDALNKVADKHGFDYWVSNTGRLKIGFNGSEGNLFAVKAHNPGIALSRYSITESENRVNAVNMRSPYVNPEEALAGNGSPLYIVSEASTDEFGGTAIQVNSQVGAAKPEIAEKQAARRLTSESMDDSSGSFEINGMASRDNLSLAQMDAGDWIVIDDKIREGCEKNVITGLFYISGLNHTINRQRGWSINVQVAQVPRPSLVETRSVYYDPLTEKQYDDYESYKRAVQDRDPDDIENEPESEVNL